MATCRPERITTWGALMTTGVGNGSERQAQASDSSKVTEVIIARDQADVVVEAALCDEGVSEAGAVPLGDELRSQLGCSLPESRMRVQQRELREQGCHVLRQAGVAQELRQHDGGKAGLMIGQSALDERGVVTSRHVLGEVILRISAMFESVSSATPV